MLTGSAIVLVVILSPYFLSEGAHFAGGVSARVLRRMLLMRLER